MDKPIYIISATRGKKEDTLLYKSLQYQDSSRYVLQMHENNTKGLPEVYNQYLEASKY